VKKSDTAAREHTTNDLGHVTNMIGRNGLAQLFACKSLVALLGELSEHAGPQLCQENRGLRSVREALSTGATSKRG
jgi:hypothetical protein